MKTFFIPTGENFYKNTYTTKDSSFKNFVNLDYALAFKNSFIPLDCFTGDDINYWEDDSYLRTLIR